MYSRSQKAGFDVSVAASPVSKAYRLPKDRGKGFLTVHLAIGVDSGSPTLTVTYQPAFCDSATGAADSVYDALASGDYSLPTGATAKPLRIYKCAGGLSDFSAISVSDGELYMCMIDEDGLPWDAVQFNFTVTGATVNVTPTICVD